MPHIMHEYKRHWPVHRLPARVCTAETPTNRRGARQMALEAVGNAYELCITCTVELYNVGG